MKNPPHHHLLLGLLALQNGFISKEQLVASFSLWTLNKQQSLDSILFDQKAITEPVRGLLNALVEQHLLRHGNDPELSLAALSSVPPIKGDLDRIGDPDIQASIAGLPPDRRDDVNQLPLKGRPEKEVPDEAGRTHPPDQWPTLMPVNATPSNRFIVLRPHAEGGLGKVSVALDRELNRNVAFKEILTPHADDVVSQERFIREAEITGQLEHPGIVPVYGLGSYGDGRPYYAMRFVEGENLKTAIASFHKDLKLKSPLDSNKAISFRNLLGRFVDVCQAIEYAHSRHVLHRDLKPDNILLGPYGETLVVDWGLAKPVGSQEITSGETKGRSVQLRSGSGSQTVDGSVVGTPNYMSPEQAQGKIDELGAATDVYSLGATMYALLTGKPPFSGGKLHETLEKVRRGELELPRKYWSSVPRALEAICMKAMSVAAKDRYQSARALGEDIEKWLADESVAAYAEPFSVRAKRWIKRHPALVAGATVCTLLSLATSGIVAYQAGEHARELQIKNETIGLQINEISSQKDDLAKRNDQLIIARNAAEDSRKLETMAREQAQASRALETESRELAQFALLKSEMQLKQITELAHDKTVEAEKANRLSSFLLGLFQAADPVGQGKGIFVGKPSAENLTARQLLDRGASKLNAEKELNDLPLTKATILATIGDVYRQLGVFSSAKPLLDEALILREKNLPENHAEIAASYHDLGAWYHENGDYAQGFTHYGKALAMRRLIPGDDGLRLVANTLTNLAWLKGYDGESEQAKKLFLEAAAIRERVLGPDHRDYIFCHVGAAFCAIDQDKWHEVIPKLVWAQSKLANVDDNRNVTKALTTFGQARVKQETLGAKFAEPDFRETLRLLELELGPENLYTALARFELGMNQVSLGNDDEAMLHFEACLKVAREAMKLQHPRIRMLIIAQSTQLIRVNRIADAESLWKEFLVAQRTRFGNHHRYVYEAMMSEAAFFRAIDKNQEAINNFRAVGDGLKELNFTTQPWIVALTYSERCSIMCEEGSDFSNAEQVAQEAIAMFEKHPDLKRDHPNEWTYLHCDLGEIYTHLDNPKAAKQLEFALSLASKLSGERRPKASNYAMLLQTDMYLRQKDYAAAAERCIQRKKHCRKLPERMIDVCGDLMRCIKLVRSNEALSADEQMKLIEDWENETISNLRIAIESDSNLRKSIMSDKRFERLRERSEFIELTTSKEPGTE